MEFIQLFNLAALLLFVGVKIIQAYKETYNIKFKKEQTQFTTDSSLLYYSDGKQIKSVEW